MAYHEIIESIGPDDFYIMKKALGPHFSSFTMKELLTFLRYTVWDARTFLEMYNILLERLEKEDKIPKDELVTAIFKVWDNYYPIGEEGDLSYCLGSLLVYLGYDNEAIEMFQISRAFYGEDAAINYEIAVCHYNMQEFDKAMVYLEKSLQLNTGFEESLSLKNRIEEYLRFE